MIANKYEGKIKFTSDDYPEYNEPIKIRSMVRRIRDNKLSIVVFEFVTHYQKEIYEYQVMIENPGGVWHGAYIRSNRKYPLPPSPLSNILIEEIKNKIKIEANWREDQSLWKMNLNAERVSSITIDD